MNGVSQVGNRVIEERRWSQNYMGKKKRLSEKYQLWVDARRQYHLSDVGIQMARELGMDTKKFGKIVNERQVFWKKLLPVFKDSAGA